MVFYQFHQGRMEESFDLFIRTAEKRLTELQVQAHIRYNLGIIMENGYLGEPNYCQKGCRTSSVPQPIMFSP